MVCDYFQGNIPSLEVEYYQEMFTYLNKNILSTLSCYQDLCFLINDGNLQIVVLKDVFVLRQKKKCSYNNPCHITKDNSLRLNTYIH